MADKYLGRIASAISAAAQLVTTPWGTVMTTVVALVGAVLGWITDREHVASLLYSILIFNGILWAVIGIVWLISRKSAIKVISAETLTVVSVEDYKYRLAYDGLSLGFDAISEESSIQVCVHIRNASAHPMKYYVDDFQVIIGTTSNPWIRQDFEKGGIIPPMIGRLYRFPSFKKGTVTEQRQKGQIKFTMLYGHPDRRFVRSLKMEIACEVAMRDGKPLIADIIISEKETEVSDP